MYRFDQNVCKVFNFECRIMKSGRYQSHALTIISAEFHLISLNGSLLEEKMVGTVLFVSVGINTY